MLDPDTKAFLGTGCALIVGTVDADGEPHAGRAWGLDVLVDGPDLQVRVLLDAGDPVTIERLAAGGAVAVTATDVRTLRSTQLKGRCLGVWVATPDDEERSRRFIDDFFDDIVATDGTDRALLERFAPVGVVPCTIEVHERFDQTPGPGAGARVGS